MDIKYGRCAKTIVRCTIVSAKGKHYIGENWCTKPQDKCPRIINDNYEKCISICGQIGHAEQVAVKIAGSKAKGSRAYLQGHTYICMDCQHILFGAGVKSISVGKPPECR